MIKQLKALSEDTTLQDTPVVFPAETSAPKHDQTGRQDSVATDPAPQSTAKHSAKRGGSIKRSLVRVQSHPKTVAPQIPESPSLGHRSEWSTKSQDYEFEAWCIHVISCCLIHDLVWLPAAFASAAFASAKPTGLPHQRFFTGQGASIPGRDTVKSCQLMSCKKLVRVSEHTGKLIQLQAVSAVEDTRRKTIQLFLC